MKSNVLKISFFLALMTSFSFAQANYSIKPSPESAKELLNKEQFITYFNVLEQSSYDFKTDADRFDKFSRNLFFVSSNTNELNVQFKVGMVIENGADKSAAEAKCMAECQKAAKKLTKKLGKQGISPEVIVFADPVFHVFTKDEIANSGSESEYNFFQIGILK